MVLYKYLTDFNQNHYKMDLCHGNFKKRIEKKGRGFTAFPRSQLILTNITHRNQVLLILPKSLQNGLTPWQLFSKKIFLKIRYIVLDFNEFERISLIAIRLRIDYLTDTIKITVRWTYVMATFFSFFEKKGQVFAKFS